MDRPNLKASIWSATDYIEAWRHIRQIFREEKADKVSWVWCPTATGFTVDRAAQYYPGDADVDWVCATVYPGEKFDDFSTASRAFLDWAKGHPGKPAMIAEWGTSDLFPGGQSAWVQQASQVARANPDIKALVYFDENGKGEGRRAQLALAGTGISDFGALLAEPYFNQRRLPIKR
jgi:beta-mannanase